MKARASLLGWRRWTTEFFVLVFGIVSAFGLQAWWDGRQAKAREIQILQDLSTEFADARSHIESRYARHVERAGSFDQLLVQTNSVELGSDLVVKDSLLTELVSFYTLEVPSGVLGSVTSSGEIALISDRQLRALLSAWPTLVGDALESQGLQRDFAYESVLTALGPNDVSLAIAQPRIDAEGRAESIPVIPGTSRPVRITGSLRNFVAVRLRLELIIVRDIESLLQNLDAIELRLDLGANH